jgi:hypothetical protein
VSSIQCTCAILSSEVCPVLQCFSTLSHKRQDFFFFKLDKKCIFWFSVQRLTETFLLLRGTEKDMIKIYIGLHVKYMLFLSYCNETCIFWTDSRKILKYQHSWKYIQLQMSFSIRTDRQTDMMKLTIIFDILLTHVIKMEVDETSFVWYETCNLTIPVCSARNVMLLKCVFVSLFCLSAW